MKIVVPFFLLIVCCSFFPEGDFIFELKKKSDEFFARNRRAKLELFFDQPKYAAGDTVRFRVAYLNADDLKPVAGRQIVHLFWFDQHGKKALTQWATVTDGWASCEMTLPKSLPQGNYAVVAYTNWMKNFDQDLFFRQKFVVAGKFSMEQIYRKDTLLFYPEGGALVEEVENNLALRYQGSDEKAAMSIHENGKELATLSLTRDSISIFQFTPKKNVSYTAELKSKSEARSIPLPVAQAAIGLKVNFVGDEVKIESALPGGLKKEKYFLVMFNNSGLTIQSEMDFDESGRNLLTFPSKRIKGVTQIAVIDSKYNLLASRVIFANGFSDKKIVIENITDTYETRQPIKMQLRISDTDGTVLSGTFSSRIINHDLLNGFDANELGYLKFQSDISNTFPLKKNCTTMQAINNYLISQTCPWFNWKRIISNESKTPLFKAQEYLNVAGHATFSKNGKPVHDSTKLMLFLEKNLSGFETMVMNKGAFSFPLFIKNSKADRFFYTAALKGNDIEQITIKIADPDSSLVFFAEPWSLNERKPDAYALYSAQRNTISSSYAFFSKPNSLNDSIIDPNKAIEEELGGADVMINLADYLMMPTMEEVIREILRGVEYRKINERHVVRLYTTAKKPTNFSGPLYVIDGVITKDAGYFLGLKPSDVISIKIVKDSRRLLSIGQLGANGVILVKTKSKNHISEKHVIDFPGFLSAPVHESATTSGAEYPNFKSCLWWSSKINIKGTSKDEVQFNASDDTGKFLIQVSGVTEDGVPVYSEQPFTVKFSKR